MKHQTSTLTGAQLNYAVALALGYKLIDIPVDARGENASRVLAPPGLLESGWQPAPRGKYSHMLLDWSSKWEDGGPIIDREHISIKQGIDGGCYAYFDHANATAAGSTALEAAMRAYVAAKLGEEVEVPE